MLKKRLSEIRRELIEQDADLADHLADLDLASIATVAGIPIYQIEDDENITEEPQMGWAEEIEQRRTTERTERKQQQTERTIARGDMGGSYRIAAALARNGGKA